MHDVVIVGAGPAGAAAALAARSARPDCSVLLIDGAAFPRDKACGDAISPHAVAVLADLGGAEAIAGYPQMSTFELTDGHAVAKAAAAANTHTVPRRVFDDRLRRAALAAGATPLRHRVRRMVQANDHVVLDGVIAGRIVVAADGANSRIRRLLGHDRNPPRALAIAMRGYATGAQARVHHIALDDAHWPAYGWSFAIGDGTANVGWGTTVAGVSGLRSVGAVGPIGALLRERTAGMTDAPVAGLVAHHLPLSTHRPPPWRGRVLLAGDAASLINPLSGEGIFYALVSGALAGRAAVVADAAGPAYARALQRRLGRHLRHTRVAARLLDNATLRRAGLRASADPAVFADIAELALGDGLLTPRTVAGLLRSVVRQSAAGGGDSSGWR